MQNAAGGRTSGQSDGRNDSDRSIVSDLEWLIEQVEASMMLIESAIAREAPPGNQEVAANVVVLDDVTPRYVKATAALDACHARLGVALHFLLDTTTSNHGTDAPVGSARRPVRSIRRA